MNKLWNDWNDFDRFHRMDRIRYSIVSMVDMQGNCGLKTFRLSGCGALESIDHTFDKIELPTDFYNGFI